ncbi:OmpA family protein [Pedobacter puniceum]|uniref:OmpA family protein n=1 Tax=Pedobacter puniceum TaxID=2666136 RepID=A0A7K0FMJ5_9SPHI|nr:OmpA family protein [Pedobacter puniceum]MRX46891.1 OmpA family protein [Pedobacter puniceum]
MKYLKKILIICTLCLGILPLAVQSTSIKRADRLYQKYDYNFAIQIYEKLLKKRPNLAIAEKLANCYRYTNDAKNAERVYAMILGFQNFKPSAYKYYADALKQNGKHQQAKENYEKFLSIVPQDASIIKNKIASCDSAIKWLHYPNRQVEIKPFMLANSEFADFSMSIYKQNFVFSSDRKIDASKANKYQNIYGWTGNAYLKLYEYQVDNQNIIPFPVQINTDYHNGTSSFSAKGDTIYFTRTEKPKGRNKGSFKFIRNAIYFAVKQNGVWSKATRLFGDGINYSAQHPALSVDGQLLYFASNMKGTVGGMDIFVSRKNADHTWSEPINCGTSINTLDDEVFPVVKNNQLYFSSNGRIGLGGLDIFKADGSINNFTDAINLQAPINSTNDDFGMVFTDDFTGYLSSNRLGGKGLDDIYSFNITPPKELIFALKGIVVQKGTTFTIGGAKILITNLSTNEVVELVTDNLGKFVLDTLQKETDYKIALYNSRNSVEQELTISTKGLKESKTFEVKLELEIKENDIVRLNNIYFNFDKWDIRYDASKELNKVFEYLKNAPLVHIELRAHTDARGSMVYNQYLSQQRAESAMKYLIQKGIEQYRLKAIGFGETMLENHCKDGVKCSEKDHALNRRVEFKVIKDK